jgi:hypothetical protein
MLPPYHMPIIHEPYRDYYRSESDSEYEYNISTNSSMYETLLMQCLWQMLQYIDWDESENDGHIQNENELPTDNGHNDVHV